MAATLDKARAAGTVDLHVVVDPGAPEAPSVVLLHGLGSSSADWAPQLGDFGRRFRLIRIDLRGHGRSPRGRAPATIETLADDVRRALIALGERSVHVVGLSLGGCVALELALQDPGRVRSLTLVNAFARLAPSGPRGVFRMVHRLVLLCVAPMPIVAAHVARGLFPKPEQHDLYRAAVSSLGACSRRTYFHSIRALLAWDARTRLASVGCPTLVIAGERDGTVPRSAALALARGIAGAGVVVVPDSGHATPIDQPDRFNAAVIEFIERAR